MRRADLIANALMVALVGAIFALTTYALWLHRPSAYYADKGTATCYSGGQLVYAGPFYNASRGGIDAINKYGEKVTVYGQCVVIYQK